MKLNVYSVFDSAAKAFIPPFALGNDELAIRTFADCANQPDHHFCKFPTDFTLFRIGVFDDEIGSVIPESEHVNLGLAASFQVRIPSNSSDEV